jgi:glutamine amidotransferase PdxT
MAEIEQEKLKLDERLAELEQRDLRVSAKCAGMIFLWNEGVTG